MLRYLNQRTGAVTLSVASNTTLIVFKLLVGLYTGSVSVMSEAIHSSTDLLAALIAFYAIRTAAKPADEEHPYGYAKAESVAAAVEALLIFLAAGLIIYEAVKRLIEGVVLENVDWAIAVMIFSSVVNFFVSRHLYRVARRTESPALAADAAHLSTDLLTALGVGLGLLAVRITGVKAFDPLLAIGVALFILKAAYDITRGALSDLVDASLPISDQAKIREILNAHSRLFSSVRVLRTRRGGGRRHVYVAIEFPPSVSMSDAHAIAMHLENEIRQLYPSAAVIVEAEAPVRPEDTPETVSEMVQRVARRMGAPVHHISVLQTGDLFNVSLHLEVDAALSLEEAHALATQLEEELRKEISGLARVDTHIEPAGKEALPEREYARDQARVESVLGAMQKDLPQIRGVHDVEVQRTDATLTVTLHLPLEGGVPIAEAHRLSSEIEARLKDELPDLQSVFVHAEPRE